MRNETLATSNSVALFFSLSCLPAFAECPITGSDVRRGIVIEYDDSQIRYIQAVDGDLTIEDFYFERNVDDYWRIVSYYGFIPIYIGQFLRGEEVLESVTEFHLLSDPPSLQELEGTVATTIPVRQIRNGQSVISSIEVTILERATTHIGNCEYQTLNTTTAIDFPDMLETTGYSYIPQLGLSITESFLLAFKDTNTFRFGDYFPLSISTNIQ